jgi:hypothetical protein
MSTDDTAASEHGADADTIHVPPPPGDEPKLAWSVDDDETDDDDTSVDDDTDAAPANRHGPLMWAGLAVLVVAITAALILLVSTLFGRNRANPTHPHPIPSLPQTVTIQATPPPAVTSPVVTTTTTTTEPVPAFQTALPACYDSMTVTERPSGAALLCHGHWLENLSWSSWGPDAADGAGVDAMKNCTPNCATGELSRNPVEVHFSGPAPPPADSHCPSEVRYYTQLIVVYRTSQPPDFYTGGEGGPVSERYNGMPSYRWNGLTPHCY